MLIKISRYKISRYSGVIHLEGNQYNILILYDCIDSFDELYIELHVFYYYFKNIVYIVDKLYILFNFYKDLIYYYKK